MYDNPGRLGNNKYIRVLKKDLEGDLFRFDCNRFRWRKIYHNVISTLQPVASLADTAV
jgi:hypothetical protein